MNSKLKKSIDSKMFRYHDLYNPYESLDDNEVISAVVTGDIDRFHAAVDAIGELNINDHRDAMIDAIESDHPEMIPHLLLRGWNILWDAGVISRALSKYGFEVAYPLMVEFTNSPVFSRFIENPDGYDPNTDPDMFGNPSQTDISLVFLYTFEEARQSPYANSLLNWLYLNGWVDLSPEI